jgi:hypothetical protein
MKYVRNSRHCKAAGRAVKPGRQAESGSFTHGSTGSFFLALVFIGTVISSAGAFAAGPKPAIVEGAERPGLELVCQGSPIPTTVSESRKGGPGLFNPRCPM